MTAAFTPLAQAIARVLQPIPLRRLDEGGAVTGDSSWNPALWFQSNEQGVWLDPSDVTRYMSELGPELSQDISFDDTTKWNKGTGWSVTGGQAVHNGAAADYVNSLFSPVVGKTYKYVLDIAEIPAGSNVIVYCNGVSGPAYTAPGVYTATIFCSLASVGAIKHSVRASNASGGTTRINSFSIKEVTSASTATLFQDSVGALPVTGVEQPVGLALDKRLGLVRGLERVSDPDLNDAAAWAPTGPVVVSGGVATFTNASTGNACKTASTTATEVGKWYEIEVVVNSISSGSLSCAAGQGTTPVKSGLVVGTNKMVMQFTGSVGTPTVYAVGTTNAVVSRISVKEVPGNHAYQATSSARATLSARKNLATQTENLLHANWTRTNVTVVGGVLAPDGTNTAFTVTATAADAKLQQIAATTKGCSSIWIRRRTGTGAVKGFRGDMYVDYPQITSEWQRLTIPHGVTNSQYTMVNLMVSGDAVDVWHPQVEAGTPTATAYQRVNTSTDYDTVGFPHYLKFDTVDDKLDFMLSMQAMTPGVVIVGMERSADLALPLHDPNNASSSFIFATADGNSTPPAGTAVINGSYRSNGLAITNTRGAIAATMPLNSPAVLSLFGWTASTPWTSMRLGHYSGYAGCSRIYQLIIRGAATADITPGEAYVAEKSGAPSWVMPANYNPATGLYAMPSSQGLWLNADVAGSYGSARGPELVDTANTASAWIVYGNNLVTQDGEAVRIQYVDAASGAGIQLTSAQGLSSDLVRGKWYEAKFRAKVNTGSALVVLSSTEQGSLSVTAMDKGFTEYSLVFSRGVNSPAFQLASFSAGEVVWIDRISVKEILNIGEASLYQDANGVAPLLAAEVPAGLIYDMQRPILEGPTLNWYKSAGDGAVTVNGAQVTVTGATSNTSINNPIAGPYNEGWGAYWRPHYAGGGPVGYPGRSTVEVLVTSISGSWLLYAAGSPVTLVLGYNRISTSTGAVGTGERVQGTGAITFTVLSNKWVPGQHAIQSTSAHRPVVSALRNLLTKTEELGSSPWTLTNVTTAKITQDGIVLNEIRETTGTGQHKAMNFYSGTPPTPAKVSFVVKANGRTKFYVGQYDGLAQWDVVDLVAGTMTSSIPQYTNRVVTPLGGGLYRVSFTTTGGWGSFTIALSNGSTDSYTGDGASGIYVGQLQLEAGSTVTPYQWVDTVTNYNRNGSMHYWKHDGVDDGAATPTFPAGTFGKNMDLFFLVRRDANDLVLAHDGSFTRMLGLADAQNIPLSLNSGTPDYYVNGALVGPGGAGTTRAHLKTALTAKQWCVVEVRDADMSAWTSFNFGNYGSGLSINGAVAEILIAPTQSLATRAHIRQYLAAQAGIVLP